MLASSFLELCQCMDKQVQPGATDTYSSLDVLLINSISHNASDLAQILDALRSSEVMVGVWEVGLQP
jgi:hypothetical protein